MQARQAAGMELAPGKSNLELASEVLRIRMAQQKFRASLRVRSHVKDFVAANPRERTSGDVAHDISTRFLGRDSHSGESTHQGRSIVDMNEVILNVLTGRNVRNPIRIFFR